MPAPAAHVLDWAALSGDDAYRALLSLAQQRFATDSEFAAYCLDASAWVLDRRLTADVVPSESQLRSAARYFLAELPMFLGAVAGGALFGGLVLEAGARALPWTGAALVCGACVVVATSAANTLTSGANTVTSGVNTRVR